MGASLVKAILVALLGLAMGTGAIGATGAPGAPSASSSPACSGAAHGSWDHVIVIVMENHGFSQVAGHSPYLNGLARRCGIARRYSGVAHPSLPNYMAMTSGRTFSSWSASDCTAAPGCSTDARSIFAQVKDWKAYEEHMTTDCQTSNDDAKHYAVRHNPPPYFTKISKACAKNDVPLRASSGGLVDDLANGALPSFAFITPDLRHDEHDASVAVGDKWLHQWVPKILNSATYKAGHTVLFITYDESEGGSSNRVYTVVVAPSVKRHTVSRARFNHYSMLKTWENMLGAKCLSHSCKAHSMAKAFGL
ncbi:MAG: phosphatidylinositol-3-phosphatase [Actinomycetota bacterium]|nr:phosphatidylinositol-3-phosphatase [Actinomycetota bacterium]